jgi:hypothetical protein
MQFDEPICFRCKHYDIKTLRCPAFPGRDVPDKILFGEVDHNKPLPEQKNDIVFEPKGTYKQRQ